ncbi:MAG TPA: VCBS repeat-containing protein [Kofleriaceae bacterium]|nr:VCBS repeat-containing protein [Kofleriaceae bacterium]
MAVVAWCLVAAPARVAGAGGGPQGPGGPASTGGPGGPTRAGGPAAGDSYLTRLAAAVRGRLDAARQSHVARLVPPVPVTPRWKPQKLGSLDLGAPLVAVAAADLDGDGKAELYLVTAREVIAVGAAGKLRELGRVAFTGEPAVPAPRDVVGTAVVDGTAVIAGVSAWAKDLRIEWRGKALSARHGAGGFRLCADRVQLASGRNHFREGGAALFGARCRDDLVDGSGAPLRIRGELATTGALSVTVARCAPPAGPAAAGAPASAAATAECQPAGAYQVRDVGIAFEIADVDRDGTPDAVVSSASAPGDTDSVRVIALGTPGARPAYKKSFNGGVAGIAVADSDGDGVPEVIAVVRLSGATRVDLWRLD